MLQDVFERRVQLLEIAVSDIGKATTTHSENEKPLAYLGLSKCDLWKGRSVSFICPVCML